jgi:flagellar hook-basal body complex protein FliE
MITLPISSVRAVTAPTATPGIAGAGGPTSAGNGNLFTNALQNVQGSLDNADALAKQLATGELTDVHLYTAAATKAELAVQLTVTVRDRLLEAYQEIMRMQV